MLKTELLEIIANGENSGVEFKRDDIRPEQLAREIAAMLNFQGGKDWPQRPRNNPFYQDNF